jgi:hypothetical protein
MLILCLVVCQIAILVCGVGFFRLAGREKRFPSLIFMLELVGRWFQIPAERKKPWVAAAVVGFLVAAVSMIGCVALSFGRN